MYRIILSMLVGIAIAKPQDHLGGFLDSIFKPQKPFNTIGSPTHDTGINENGIGSTGDTLSRVGASGSACLLDKHPSVEYRCVSTEDATEISRPCRDQEPSGTIVRPNCKGPNYSYSSVLSNMRCTDGRWNYIAICNPECGTVTPEGQHLIINGTSAKRGELPWHAGIYSKATSPYIQICGGSLVSSTVVISAAHCFWDAQEEKAQPASMFAVAMGKLYRPWNEARDDGAQKSDVSDIKLPKHFQGGAANYQGDIAVVVLTSAVEYRTHVRPVCVNFDINFDRRQLHHRNAGKIAGWGLTAENGPASQVLKVVDLPYVELEECIHRSPQRFRQYITSDKFCAGYGNGRAALCRGDSGGGLAFPEYDRGVERYYLRGIVSTAATRDDSLCNGYTPATFTHVANYEPFIKDYYFF